MRGELIGRGIERKCSGTRECRSYKKSKIRPEKKISSLTIIDHVARPSSQGLVDRDGVHEVWMRPLLALPWQHTAVFLQVFWTAAATPEDADGDLLAVEADSAVENLVEGKAETGKGVWACLPCFYSCQSSNARELESDLCSSTINERERWELTIWEQH